MTKYKNKTMKACRKKEEYLDKNSKEEKPLNYASIQATLDNAEELVCRLHGKGYPREKNLLGRENKRIRRLSSILISR